MKAVAISALSSGQGKTLFTTSLLYWIQKQLSPVRSYKAGPDYIDTKFHEKITGYPSINLDLFMMSPEELVSVFSYYAHGFDNVVIEGVMGFYDGIDYKTSTYDISKALNVPVILVLSAEGTYSTLIPQIKGILDYKKDNMIRGIVLNKVSSEQHYQIVKQLIDQEIPEITTLGWIQKDLSALSSRHLGLDLAELENQKLDELSHQVMKYIDTKKLQKLIDVNILSTKQNPFDNDIIASLFDLSHNKNLTIVHDKAFSFLYPVNFDFLKELFSNVTMISALNNDEIPIDTDVVYLPGGYVETSEVAPILDKANIFKKSLRSISEYSNKLVYAECAGLMYLGNNIQTTYESTITGCNLLSLDFEMKKHRTRLGYYKVLDMSNLNIYRGHAFHYSNAIEMPNNAFLQWSIYKNTSLKAQTGAWINLNKNVLGTYLHTMFFNQPELVRKYFLPH